MHGIIQVKILKAKMQHFFPLEMYVNNLENLLKPKDKRHFYSYLTAFI